MTVETWWHYTDAGGLLGVLRNRQLWASSLGYLNDASEIAFGLESLEEALEDLAKDSSSRRDDIWPSNIPLERSSVDVYAVSFSTEGDQLSQWRGYAGGTGYALGFKMDALVSVGMKPGEPSLEPFLVRYGQEAKQFLRHELELRALGNHGRLTEADAGYLLRNLPRYKHGSFAEESEWRLTIIDADPDTVDVRARGGRLLPYVPVAIPRSALTHVRVGPGADAADVAAVELMLARIGWPNVAVDRSASPYR